jgi:hypothetical protein
MLPSPDTPVDPLAYPGNDALGFGVSGLDAGQFLRVRRGFARRELWPSAAAKLMLPTARNAATSIPCAPLGYPDTAIICGSLSCLEPGLIWLEHDEAEAYRQGQRIFGAVTASMNMRAEGPESQTTHRSGTE